jgi:hypothetical protein
VAGRGFYKGDKKMKELLDIGITAYDRIQEVKALNLSKKSRWRALYFEVCGNLSLIKIINNEALIHTMVTSREFASLVCNLEIQVMASILFSDEKNRQNQHLFAVLQKKGNIVYEDENADNPAGPKETHKTVLNALIFCIRRITLLQKLSTFNLSEENTAFINNLRLKVRISNIEQHLKFIKQSLAEIDKDEQFLIH